VGIGEAVEIGLRCRNESKTSIKNVRSKPSCKKESGVQIVIVQNTSVTFSLDHDTKSQGGGKPLTLWKTMTFF
jgi:hypothetical protein